MQPLPIRKPNRLKAYDYSSPGAYFVTICTQNRFPILGTVGILSSADVGEGLRALPQTFLTPLGKTVENAIRYIGQKWTNASVDRYVVMPNHVHLLVSISQSNATGGHRGPPLPTIVGALKSYTTHLHGKPFWQRSFHDRGVRGEAEYAKLWNYIETNPARWREDCFYTENG